MGYGVYFRNGRWAGYDVPGTCDQPGCGAEIDRGLSCACGGGATEDLPNCGLFFCSAHLYYAEGDDESGERQGWVCERCRDGEPPFLPTPDTSEWVTHMLTDASWAQWRNENPEKVATMTAGAI